MKIQNQSEGLILVIVLVLLTAVSFMAGYIYLHATKERRLFSILEYTLNQEKIFPLFLKKVPLLLSFYQEHYSYVPKEIQISFKEGEIKFFISSEEERFNINELSPPDLLSLLLDLKISEEKALILRDRILDWIDKDHDVRPFGKEDYEDYKPANNHFKTFYEILLVDGMDPHLLWNKMFDKITIYDGKKEYFLQNEDEEEEEKLILKQGKIYRLIVFLEQKGITKKWVLIFKVSNPPQILTILSL